MTDFIEKLRAWFKVKLELKTKQLFRGTNEGEVWWCFVGENVGIEINGKNESFTRPVLILNKLSRLGFLGVPLTSRKHFGSWYVPFVFKDKQQYAVLAQIRVFSVYRLQNKMGEISKADFDFIKSGFRKLYF